MSRLDVHDNFQVGDRVCRKIGMPHVRTGTIEAIDRHLLFSHFVRFDDLDGLWPCYRFDLEPVEALQEASHEPKTL